MRTFLRAVVSIVGTLALLAAIVAVALHFSPIDHEIPVAAASVSPIVLVVASIVALVCLLGIGAWRRVGAAVLVVAVGVWTQAPQFFDDGDLDGPTLSVMTSNIEIGGGDVPALAAAVRQHRVDILSVQELTPGAVDAIAASTIASDLPHQVVRAADLAHGTAIYSRHPLSEAKQLPGFTLNAVSAVAAVPGRGPVQVYAFHPVPPTNVETWSAELKAIASILHETPTTRPVIALGDFNATSDHVQFRRLLQHGYRDVGEIAGAGWLPTYPTDKSFPRLVGIDHILVRALSAADVTSIEIPDADHRAVVARVG